MRQKPFNELVLEVLIDLHNEELYGLGEGPEGRKNITLEPALTSYLVGKGVITLVGPLENEPRITDLGRRYYQGLLSAISQLA